MAASPVVSVIVPVYNNERHAAAALRSVLAQTFHVWELLVVDDGSTDRTPDVLAQFAGEPRVTLMRQANAGPAAARNAGIRRARGEFVAFLDGDDEWLPAYLATLLALAERQPTAAVYYCSAQCMDGDGRDLPQVAAARRVAPGDMYVTLLRANFLVPSAVLARRAALEEAGLFDPSEALRSAEDWDMWLRLAHIRPFAGTQACLARYRLHAASLMADPARHKRAAQAVVEKHFGLDDGQPAGWPPDKRTAYGGLYRLHALAALMRQGDWADCGPYLRRALRADTSLALDLDLFYELALGAQPMGYRGTAHQLDLPRNAAHVQHLLSQVFRSPAGLELAGVRRAASGAAWFALGLAAYNTGQLALCRRYLLCALRAWPALWREKRLVLPLLKSLLGRAALEAARDFSRRRSSRPEGAGQP